MDELDALLGDSLDPFAGLGLPRKSKSKYKPLPEEEQKSVIRKALNMGTGGLQYVGETLDKPGRAVRGLLGGKPGELANLIPFSDTMGLTDPSQSVSGRDLLEQAGLVGANQVGSLDVGDVAGFGAEVLLDPTTYLTFGASAVGKAGKVAKAAGISAKGAARYKTLGQHLAGASDDVLRAATEAAAKSGTTLDALSGQKLGGLFGVKVPGFESFVPGFAQGETAQAIGQGLGDAAMLPLRMAGKNKKLAKAGETISTYWKGAFDPSVQNQFDPVAQTLAKEGTEHINRGQSKVLEGFYKDSEELKNLVSDFTAKHGNDPFFASGKIDPGEIVRRAVQHSAETQGAPGAYDLVTGGLKVAPDIEARTAKLGEGIVSAENEAFKRYQELGGDVQALNDTEGFSHLFRQPLEKSTRPSGLKMRTKAMKYLPAEQVNSMIRDPSLLMTGAEKAKPDVLARRLLEGNYGKLMMDAAMAANVTPQQAAKDMAEWLSSKGTGYVREGKNFYGNDVLKNKLDYLTSLNRNTANMQAVHSVLAKNLTNELEGTVSLADAVAGAGLDPTSAIEHMARTLGQTPEALRQMRVPEEIAGAAGSVLRKQQSPEWMTKIGKGIDAVINTYKRNLTVPFPSFHVRNLLSGQWMNMASNLVETPADIGRYVGAAQEAASILKKGTPAGNQAISEMIAHKVLPLEFGTRDVDVLEAAAGALPKKGTQFLNPALGPLRMAGDLKAGVASEFRASTAAGSGNVSSAIQGAYKGLHGTGTEAARQVEYMNRASMYLYLKGKGWAPEAAAAEVRKLQIDYSDLTSFEKNVMKRVIPFYAFTRKNVPVLLQKMVEHPGGVAGKTIRASNIGRSEEDFVPPYVGEGMSVPLPGGDGRYLSELGLPTDQFANLFATGPTRFGSFKRTGQKLLSQVAPPLKAAIELPTGINLFSGKPFNEMYQYPSSDPLLNAALGETPASRYISAIRTAGDPRKELGTKAMNLLTGLRVTDVSGGLEKQKEYAAKKILDEMLREEKGIGSFSEVYAKQGAELTPEAERLYRAYRGLVSKQRKDKKKATAPARR